MIWDFIVKNKWFLLVGALSLIAGYWLTLWANKRSEERIINRLISEIQKIKL